MNKSPFSLSPDSGTGNKSCSVTCSNNETLAEKEATFTFTGGGITKNLKCKQSGFAGTFDIFIPDVHNNNKGVAFLDKRSSIATYDNYIYNIFGYNWDNDVYSDLVFMITPPSDIPYELWSGIDVILSIIGFDTKNIIQLSKLLTKTSNANMRIPGSELVVLNSNLLNSITQLITDIKNGVETGIIFLFGNTTLNKRLNIILNK